MAKLLSSLPDYEFDVVTFAGWKRWFGKDNSFEKVINEKFGVVEYLKIPKVIRWIPFGRFGPLGKLPDPYRFFNFLLLKKAKQMIQENDYKVIVTWSQPHSSHIVGLKLKSGLEKSPKWIAHFSDPWVSNPYFELKNWVKKINENLFNQVLIHADAISVTNEYVILAEESFSNPKNRRKIKVIPHSFLPSMYPCENKKGRNSQIILRYIGSFYGLRRPDPILSALAKLEANDPSTAKKLRVEFIGAKLDKKALCEIQNLKLVSIEVLPSVSFRESLGLMQNADLLLIIDAPTEISPFLPSKLIDYIGANVPVLAFTPPGPSADLVKELGGWVAPPTDSYLGYVTLRDSLKTITDQSFKYSPPTQVVEKFSSSKNGLEFLKIINHVNKEYT